MDAFLSARGVPPLAFANGLKAKRERMLPDAARVRECAEAQARTDEQRRAELLAVLEREIDRWCRAPMQWGRDDCALAVANVIRDALGYDPAAPWRTGYRNKEGAARALGPLGLGFALRRAARAHGWKRIEPAAALPGDAGMAMQDGRPVTVICKAAGWFVGRAAFGFTALRAEKIRIAWSVA